MPSQLVGPREHDRVLRLPSSLGRVDRAILEAIPAGRIYLLGHATQGPVIGSLVSGVGITPERGGISIVKVTPGDVRLVALARIAR